MTIETLNDLKMQKNRIEVLKAEIEDAYNTYHSPQFGEYGFGKSSGTGSPVQAAAFRVIELKEQLQKKIDAYYETLEEVENWLLTLRDDPELSAIIRWHYILGLNWADTSRMVFGKTYRPDYFKARKKVYRYFGEEE